MCRVGCKLVDAPTDELTGLARSKPPTRATAIDPVSLPYRSVGRRLGAFNGGAYPRQLLTISSPPNRPKHDGALQRLNRHGSGSSKVR